MNLTKELIKNIGRGGFFPSDALLPNPDRIVSGKGGYKTLRRLRNDPHVSSCIQSRRSGLTAMSRKIAQGKTSSKVLQAAEEMIAGLDIERIMRDCLEAVLYGFQAMEIIYEEKNGLITPTDVSAKPQELFFFDTEGKIRYRPEQGGKGKPTPEHKILLCRSEPTSDNPYGTALLSKCYWPVSFKNAGLRFWVNYMERFGMPMLLGKYNRGAASDEAAKLAEELADMNEAGVIVSPSDIDISIKEPMRFSSISLYKELIKLCNDEISKALLSETLTTELGSGSYAAAKVHSEVRKEVIISDKRLVEKAFGDLIKSFTEINFPGEKAPEFVITVGQSGNEEKARKDEILARACGIRFSKEYFMRTYGYKDSDIVSIGKKN